MRRPHRPAVQPQPRALRSAVSIHFAKIATNQGLVTDVFYITETGGGQVTDPEKLLNVRRLLKAVAADYMEAKR